MTTSRSRDSSTSARSRISFFISSPPCAGSSAKERPVTLSFIQSRRVTMDCLFCKIVAGDIPAQKIYEDDQVIAFNDIAPQAPVHFLVIPKKHIATLHDLSEEDDKALRSEEHTSELQSR